MQAPPTQYIPTPAMDVQSWINVFRHNDPANVYNPLVYNPRYASYTTIDWMNERTNVFHFGMNIGRMLACHEMSIFGNVTLPHTKPPKRRRYKKKNIERINVSSQ